MLSKQLSCPSLKLVALNQKAQRKFSEYFAPISGYERKKVVLRRKRSVSESGIKLSRILVGAKLDKVLTIKEKNLNPVEIADDHQLDIKETLHSTEVSQNTDAKNENVQECSQIRSVTVLEQPLITPVLDLSSAECSSSLEIMPKAEKFHKKCEGIYGNWSRGASKI